MSGNNKLKLLLLPTIITLVAFVILFRLGWWQLQRAEEKQQELSQINSAQNQRVLTLEAQLRNGNDIQHANVLLTGKMLANKLFYWDNRIKDSAVGYEVIGLLNTNSGLVAVNFGWVPAMQTRDELPPVEIPTQLIEEAAVLSAPRDNVFVKETLTLDSPWPKRIQQPDLELMAKHAGQKLLPFVAFLEAKGRFKRNFEPVVMPPEKHIAYAIQWFGLALAVLVVFYFAVKKKVKNDTEKQ